MSVIRIKGIFLTLLILMVGSSLFAQKQNLNIIYIGDSITQGSQLGDPISESPPAIASNWLSRQKGVEKVKFSNQGVSGFTTVDFLPSTQIAFDRVKNVATALNDRKTMLLFSIMLGTNDSASEGPNGSPVSPEQYHDNLKTIINRLLRYFPNAKFVIQRPIWYSPNTYNGSRYLQEGLSRLQSYFPQIDKLIIEYNSTNAGHVFSSDTKAFDYFKEHYLTELRPEQGREGIFYLHPNKKGAATLGTFWAQAIYLAINKK